MSDVSKLSELIRQKAFLEAGGGQKDDIDKIGGMLDLIKKSGLDRQSLKEKKLAITKAQEEIIATSLANAEKKISIEKGRRATTPIEIMFGKSPQAGVTAGT